MTYYYSYEGREHEEYLEYQFEYPENEILDDGEPYYEYRYVRAPPRYRTPYGNHRVYRNPRREEARDVYYLERSFSPIYTSQKYTNHSKLYVQLHNECATHYEDNLIQQDSDFNEDEEEQEEEEGDDEEEELVVVVQEKHHDVHEERFKQNNGKTNRRKTCKRHPPRKKLKRKRRKPTYARVCVKRIQDDKVVKETVDETSTDVNLQEPNSIKFVVQQQRSSGGESMRLKQDDSSSHIPDMYSQNTSLHAVKTKFHSISNVRSIAEENTTSGEMVGWTKHSMPDSTTESTMISSDCCTNITINSDEYREFINQINKIPQMASDNSNEPHTMLRTESAPPVGIGTILKSFYDSTNNSTKVPNTTQLLTNKTIDSKSDPVNKRAIRKMCAPSRRREIHMKVNPLSEVPLMHMFKWAIPSEPYKHKKKSQELKANDNSTFLKVLRFFVTVIIKFQSIAYRYALRYILFI